MRKLLFLLPLTLGAALAKTPMSTTTAIFRVPAGAKTIVIEMDGTTHTADLVGQPATLPIHIVMTPTGVRLAYSMKSSRGSREASMETQVNLQFKPFAQRQVSFSPALNAWATMPTGTATGRWKVTFGHGQGFRKESNVITVNVLFTQKNEEKIKDDLRPPERP